MTRMMRSHQSWVIPRTGSRSRWRRPARGRRSSLRRRASPRISGPPHPIQKGETSGFSLDRISTVTHFFSFWVTHCQLTLIWHFTRNVLQSFCLTHFLRTDHMRHEWWQWAYYCLSCDQMRIQHLWQVTNQSTDHWPLILHSDNYLTLMNTAFCFDELLTTKIK